MSGLRVDLFARHNLGRLEYRTIVVQGARRLWTGPWRGDKLMAARDGELAARAMYREREANGTPIDGTLRFEWPVPGR